MNFQQAYELETAALQIKSELAKIEPLPAGA